MNRLINLTRKIILLLLIILLVACDEQGVDDLKSFVSKTKAKSTVKINPLPVFTSHKPFEYSNAQNRDPFNPVVETDVVEEMYTGPRPDEERTKEPLEDYPLDSLRMMGILSQDENIWAIIRDPEGLLHRVSIGHYMGKNYGKVISITEHEVSLTELISKGKGVWENKNISIVISE